MLYRLELDGGCTTVLTGLTISNGIGWSPDGAIVYLADSGTGHVEAFGFDGATGELSRRRTLVRIQRPGAVPDGLAVDQQGAIWVAVWGGGAVERYGADGSLLARVGLPVDRPTSCAFGGSELAMLFVTTARAGLDEAALARQPHAGHVFRFDGLGVTGMPCRAVPGADRLHSHPRLTVPMAAKRSAPLGPAAPLPEGACPVLGWVSAGCSR